MKVRVLTSPSLSYILMEVKSSFNLSLNISASPTYLDTVLEGGSSGLRPLRPVHGSGGVGTINPNQLPRDLFLYQLSMIIVSISIE